MGRAMQRTAPRIAVVWILAAVLLGGVACSTDSGPGGGSTGPTGAVPLSPPAPQNDAQAYASALVTLRKSVRINMDAYRKGDGDATLLETVATGEALAEMTKTVRNWAREGYRPRGAVRAEPVKHQVGVYRAPGVDISFGKVTITSCFDYSHFRLVRKDGSAVPRSGLTRSLFVQNVVYDTPSASWKIESASTTGQRC